MNEVKSIVAREDRCPGMTYTEMLEGDTRRPPDYLFEETVAELGRRFADSPTVLFLGRHVGYRVALEGALKLKELAYMHADTRRSERLTKVHEALGRVLDEIAALEVPQPEAATFSSRNVVALPAAWPRFVPWSPK